MYPYYNLLASLILMAPPVLGQVGTFGAVESGRPSVDGRPHKNNEASLSILPTFVRRIHRAGTLVELAPPNAYKYQEKFKCE